MRITTHLFIEHPKKITILLLRWYTTLLISIAFLLSCHFYKLLQQILVFTFFIMCGPYKYDIYYTASNFIIFILSSSVCLVIYILKYIYRPATRIVQHFNRHSRNEILKIFFLLL